MNNKPIPIILDTDIGNDIDDNWALGLLLKTPELFPKLVLSATGDTEYRAFVAAKFLDQAGYPEIPVAVGIAAPEQPAPESQRTWLGIYSAKDYPGKFLRNGLEQMAQLVAKEPEATTVIGIGPLTNLAAFCRYYPGLVAKCRLVAMLGSIYRQYDGELGAVAEYNVKIDIQAAQTVLAAPWREIVITPLDHCGVIRLDGERYRSLKESADPVVGQILSGYRAYRAFFGQTGEETASSPLFDTAAIHLAWSDAFTEFETLPLIVDDQGFTRISPQFGRPVKTAVGWSNLEGYLDFLVTRLLDRASQEKSPR